MAALQILTSMDPDYDGDLWSSTSTSFSSLSFDSTLTLLFSKNELIMRLSMQKVESFYNARKPRVEAPWPEPPSPTSTTTFEYFPLLPTAVRGRVFKHALPDSRVVRIRYRRSGFEFFASSPVLLQVSRQARSVTLAFYELIDASTIDKSGHEMDRKSCYVDFARDTFCPTIPFRNVLCPVTGEYKKLMKTLPHSDKIQKLGLPKRCFIFPNPALISVLLGFETLKEVVVLSQPFRDKERRQGTPLVEWWLDLDDVLPIVEESEARSKLYRELSFEGYAVAYLNKLREGWKDRHGRELRFVCKRVCQGRQWNETGQKTEWKEERGHRHKFIKMMDKSVSRVMMLVL